MSRGCLHKIFREKLTWQECDFEILTFYKVNGFLSAYLIQK